MSHYFTNDAHVKSEPKTYHVSLFNLHFTFLADHGVFSMNGLDFGTKSLLENIQLNDAKSLLDVGCGVGPIGIILKTLKSDMVVDMIDVNQRAIGLAKANAQTNKVDVNVFASYLYEKVNQTYDVIVSNPPIRTGKKVIYPLYENAYDHLNEGGALWIVVQKKQGAPSTVSFLETIYNKVNVVAKVKGYFIICAIK